MERAQCIETIYPELEDRLVVTIMGACAQELYDLGHRENFFYLQHAMGLASSIGLGLALHRPEEEGMVDGGCDNSALRPDELLERRVVAQRLEVDIPVHRDAVHPAPGQCVPQQRHRTLPIAEQ